MFSDVKVIIENKEYDVENICDFPDYYATRDGVIISHKRGYNWKNWKYAVVKPRHNDKGYLTVPLFQNGKHYTKRVHRLVWVAYNGSIPDGLEINHKNEVRDDNRLENLELMTHKQNLMYGSRKQKHIESVKEWWSKNKHTEKGQRAMSGLQYRTHQER